MTTHISSAEIRCELEALADASYREFASKLIPGEQRMLGVRLPQLRALAKRLARAGMWRLRTPRGAAMEEVMLRGMLIGYAGGVGLAGRLAALDAFLPLITNWSICDSCCATYDFVRRNREQVWDWAVAHALSEQEYEARFGVVLLLMHYAREAEWAEQVAELLPRVVAQGYYAEMAVAWCACELCLQQPQLREKLEAALRPQVCKRMLRKLRESTRTR